MTDEEKQAVIEQAARRIAKMYTGSDATWTSHVDDAETALEAVDHFTLRERLAELEAAAEATRRFLTDASGSSFLDEGDWLTMGHFASRLRTALSKLKEPTHD